MPTRAELKDATIICFDCNGCMASDHQFRWIGSVIGFRENRLTSESAMVQVHKRWDVPSTDERQDLGFEYPVAADSSLQKIGPNLFCLYK